MADMFDNWTVQARKGILELAILTALADRRRYAYDLVRSLVDIPGLGISEGTIYPLLSRLRVQGLVETRLEESAEGPARKYYSITNQGHRTLEMMKNYLDAILNGSKTVESRLTKGRTPPFGCIEPGDKLFFKQSGGPVRAVGIVAAVKSFDNLTPAKIAEIKSKYNRRMGFLL